METLANYLNDDRVPEPLVIASPESEVSPPRTVSPAPAIEVPREVPFLEDVGEFIVDQLNRRQTPFGDVWLIHEKDGELEKKGKFQFTLQRKHHDQHRPKELDRVVLSVRMLPYKPPLLKRVLDWMRRR